ncbi:MAG TPA: FAD-dependent oxidoreductase [Actinophytocola sp.]|nr:FAD-dependent oxidoreductase [Actinophytocola sp.]
MNRRERIVIVGAGLCGLRAAERLRELGFEGEVIIIGDEASPPYHRPALSKQLLMGTMRPDDLLLPAYQNVHAKWRLNTPVQYLLPRSRTLRLPGEEELKYDGLIIATGVEARRANDVPYEDHRIHVLRTLPDALDLERTLSENRGPVAVIGGGFTGCEIASSLRHMGREVTLIQRGKTLLGNVLGQDLGVWLTKLHTDHGVDLALGNRVKRWAPREDGIALQLTDGSTMLVGSVLLATGTVPSTTWLRGSGLPLDNGVVCEATCHVVGAEDVVAAGDVAQWPNIRFDTVPRRIEHWLNAIEMGRAAAENLLAGRAAATPFTPMPRFWTEQHGVRIQAAGVPKLGPEIVALGSPTDGTGTLVGYAKEGRLMGVVGIDCPKSVLAWTDSVTRQNPVPGEKTEPVPAAERPAAIERQAPAAAASATTAASRPAAPATRQSISVGTRPSSSPGTKTRVRGFAAKSDGKKGRHALPPKEERRSQQGRGSDWAEQADPAASASASSARMRPADASSARMRPADASSARMRPADASSARMRPADASSARMLPADASSARMRPADASSARMLPADASSARLLPPELSDPRLRQHRGGMVDADGRLVDATGRIGRIDAGGELVADPNPAMGPGASHARMRPARPGGAMPMPGGPAASSARMRPADPNGRMMPGARPGPEDSYDRLPAVPPINDRLRSNGPGSSARMRPVDPPWRGRGPEDSYDRMPPVDASGYLRPVPPARPGPADSYGAMPPAGAYPAQRPGPADSYTRLPEVDQWAAVQNYGPADSYDRLPPVDRHSYEMPQLNLQPWEGSGPRAGDPYGRPGPADSYDRMPPARSGHVRPLPRGPEDSYDRIPPAFRQYGPEDSYDQFPPVRRDPMGPADSYSNLRPVQRRHH